MGNRGAHGDLDPTEEGGCLLADAHQIDLDTALLMLADLAKQLAEQVGVQATAQAAIGGHHDVADELDPAARHQIRSEERRVGKGWLSTCKSRGSPYH